MAEKPEIVQLGAEILRQQARRVDDFDCSKFHHLIDDMQALMLESNGVGIAAPQLGASWQIVIIASRPTARYPNAPDMAPLLMVNPECQVLDASMHKDWEGCLSVPGIRALVPRYQTVQISYQDRQGRADQIVLRDFPARVFQHEFDHLQGLVYLDRVESNRDIISETEFFKKIAA
ncbi:peptide deformylase [Methylomonas sp. LL1]|uniref:peptide deformylase n=1 Tax=Methylomonas sp. LL1 TaxID=2785785 RepID=UPI0018C413F6|nr:peptide deformylase [Methylomonas sp. LL1]QPK63655.1 peptide deformylase [Methylomonas sp. LL1]